MAEPKWTPAPWFFHPPYSGFSKITGPNGELIFGIAAGSSDEKRPDEECQANARLIAAAPELYGALNNLAAEVGLMAGRGVALPDSLARAVDVAGAVLAKARGEG